MSILFSAVQDEEILCQIHDTGVAGATLTVKRFGKHIIFETKSPHAIMTLLNSRIEDIKELRRALKRYETTYAEIKKSESTVRLSRTQTASAVVKATNGKQQKDATHRGKARKQKD